MGYADRRKYIQFYFSHRSLISSEDQSRLHPLMLSFMNSVALGMCVGIGLLWPMLKLPFYKGAGFGVRKVVRFVTVVGPTTYAYIDSKTTTIDPFFQEMYEKYNTPKAEE